MKILIAGCGYVGTGFGRVMAGQGHEIIGLRRDTAYIKERDGIRPLRADLTQPTSLKALPHSDIVVLCQAPSKETDNYETTYRRGTANVLAALKGKKPQKLILVSSTSVYSTHDGSWVDEDTDPADPGWVDPEVQKHAECLLDAEDLVLQSSIPSIVLRLAGIYGPGRNRVQAIREGRLKPVLNDVYTNRIHLEDIISALYVLIEKGKSRQLYIGADDAPCAQSEFYNWLYGRLGIKPSPGALPSGHSRHGGNKRCSNAKLKGLGWSPRWPDYKQGYEPLIREKDE